MLTTTQVSKLLNLSPARVRVLAINRKVGRKHGRDWSFKPEEVELLRPRKVGRPKGGM